MQNQELVTWMGLNPPFSYEASSSRKQKESQWKSLQISRKGRLQHTAQQKQLSVQ